MYEYIVRAFAEGIKRIIVWAFVIGIAIGVTVVWLIPMLWNWVKPWLHSVTG